MLKFYYLNLLISKGIIIFFIPQIIYLLNELKDVTENGFFKELIIMRSKSMSIT
jgi:hypothetical protein